MSTLSIKHSVNLVNLFIDSINNPANAYYTFAGRPYPWEDENNPPSSTSSIEEIEQSIYKDIAFGKLVDSSSVKFVIPRNNWISNTVYDGYDQTDPDLYDRANFYVITDEREVYKCIFNNEDSPSIVKPSLNSTDSVFSTSDGYIWKYMFTIDESSMDKFSSNNYIVVLPNNSVEDSTIPGAIDYIKTSPSGQGYTAIHTGYLANFVNTSVVEIASNASSIDNIYTNSSIYLYSGPGANQIRTIRYYDGLNKLVYVTEPLESYIISQVANNNGFIEKDYNLVQKIDKISYLYKTGYFNIGDSIKQTDSEITGKIVSMNSSVIGIQRDNFTTPFSTDLSIFNTDNSGTLKVGNVSITVGSSNVFGTATQFTDTANGYSSGDYIRVGNNSAQQIRRIESITNSTHLIVNNAFTSTLTSNVHYKVPSAFKPYSISITENSGKITHTNFSGQILTFSNSSIVDQNYIQGELLSMVDNSNIEQGANGIVAFSNSSTVILSDVSGTFSNNFYLYGKSSTQKAKIENIVSFPSVTIEANTSTLLSGITAFSFDGVSENPVGNVVIISSYSIPNSLTLYNISPSVIIEGDGSGAKAFAVVNTDTYSAYGIDYIQMIERGNNYTYANVSIVANTLYGANAVPYAVISPIQGHGANTYLDLGARYACISTKFDIAENESYQFPDSGSYRKIGLIKNPLWNNIILNIGNLDRAKLNLSNTSGTFEFKEIITQNSTVAGVVEFANSSFVEISAISNGTFIANAVGDSIIGLNSGTTANVKFANIVSFSILANNETILQNNTLATGIVEQIISANSLKLTNAAGIFSSNICIRDITTNASAKVFSIYSSNGLIDQSIDYGKRFNQTSRMTLSSNNKAFLLNEKITQDTTEASADIFDLSSDLDLTFSSSNGSFVVGTTLTDSNTGATALIIGANSTYLKLSSLEGSINVSDTIINNLNIGATVANVYPVLQVYNVVGNFQIGSYSLIGANSGASGQIAFANTVTLPDLVKHSGEVLYIENVVPFTKETDKKEILRLVLKF